MEEPDWAKVLQVVYDQGGRVAFRTGGPAPEGVTMPSSDFIPDELKLIPNNYLDKEDTYSGFRTLRRVGLVEEITEEDLEEGYHNSRVEHPLVRVFELTQEGFNVAHEREQRKEQRKLTKGQKEATDTLADYTVILGITALVQAFAAVVSAPRYNISLALIYVILLLVLLYKREDFFTGVRDS